MPLKAKAHVSGLRVYEPGRPLEEVAREVGIANVSDLVKLASNENPMGPSPKAMKAMHDCVDRMHLYPDGGNFYLRNALAKHWSIETDQLIFGCGSNEIIELLGHVFLEPGSNIVMSEQAFIIYHLIAESWGAETRFVPSVEYTHDLDAMAAQIDADTKIVFVANPNNPTGTLLPPADIEAFVAAVPEDVLVVLDEAYIELLEEVDRPKPTMRKNLLVLRTFSKSYGLAGLRVGYGIGHPEVIQWLEKFRQPFNVTAMGQQAAVAALEDHEHLVRFRAAVEYGHAYFRQACDELDLETVPSVTNFLLLKTGAGRELFEKLKRHGVIVRPMDGYGLPDHIRVSLGTEQENRRFFNALNQEWA